MNKTGAQVQKLLDTLLYEAFHGVVTKTQTVDSQLVHVLSFITRNKKRKPCTLVREEAISTICKALSIEDREEKFELIKALGLERNIVQVFIIRLLDSYYDEFMDLYHKFLTDKPNRHIHDRRIKRILTAVGCESRSDMFTVLTNAKYYITIYRDYFSEVVNDYVKLCTHQASNFVKSKSGNFDVHDVRQRILRSVVVAINKYNSSRGALTSYIKWWIMNALTCQSSEYEYGIAYSIPQNTKKQCVTGNINHTNFSVSLDGLKDQVEGDESNLHEILGEEKPDVAHSLESDATVKALSVLYKRVDSYGLGRLVLETPEHFTLREKQKMLRHMKKYNLHKNPKHRKSVKRFKKQLKLTRSN